MSISSLHPIPSVDPAGIRPGARGDAPSLPPLANQLEQETKFQRQRALRALLQNPLLTADGPHKLEFGLVRRHADWLREWLAHNAGWSLIIDSELARLRKMSTHGDGNRPARDAKSGTPFTRRRYVLLCLALAVLEQEDRQTTLGKLAERILAAVQSDSGFTQAGITFDLTTTDQRRDLVQAVRLLLDLRVLRRINGDEEQYLNQKGDALYNICRPALSAMLCVKRGPSTIGVVDFDDRIAGITEEPIPDTDQARNRQLRANLTRRLLDDPIIYYDELTEAEGDYLSSQRSRLLQSVELATGLVGEVRKEGIAMLDSRGDMTDVGLPEEGTDGHITLLVAQFLADALRHEQRIVGEAALSHHIAQLIDIHRNRWRKDVGEPGAAEMLMRQTVDRLECLSLVKRTSGGIRPLPAIARYAVEADGQGKIEFQEM